MPRSPLVTRDDWPEPELHAAVLAGELIAVGPCWASPAVPQTPELRAAAASWALGDPRLVAVTRTAAWIWGAASRPPAPLEACVPPPRRGHPGADADPRDVRDRSSEVRVRPRDVRVRLREVSVPEDDLVRLGQLRVTAPSRTVVDLLRTPHTADTAWGPAESSAVHGLLTVADVSVDDVRARLAALGRIPMVRQAERRLRGLLDPADRDRVRPISPR